MDTVQEEGMEYEGTKVGEVTHFFDKISVAVIKPVETINTGDTIKFYDKQGNIVVEQSVDSMEIDGDKIESAEKDQEFGMKVAGDVKEGYLVYR